MAVALLGRNVEIRQTTFPKQLAAVENKESSGPIFFSAKVGGSTINNALLRRSFAILRGRAINDFIA